MEDSPLIESHPLKICLLCMEAPTARTVLTHIMSKPLSRSRKWIPWSSGRNKRPTWDIWWNWTSWVPKANCITIILRLFQANTSWRRLWRRKLSKSTWTRIQVKLRRIKYPIECLEWILIRSWSRSSKIARANISRTWLDSSVQTKIPSIKTQARKKMWRIVLIATPQSKSRFTLPTRTALTL